MSPVLVDDGLGAAVEVSRPRVVTKAGPQAQHRVEGRRGEVLECGEGLDKRQMDFAVCTWVGWSMILETDAIGRGQTFQGRSCRPSLANQAGSGGAIGGGVSSAPRPGFWNRPRRRARAGPFGASGFSSAATSAFQRTLPPC